MATAVLITGGNIGNVTENLKRAKQMLEAMAGEVMAESVVRETEPWGSVDNGLSGKFMNQLLVVETNLEPLELLEVTQEIETELGRKQDEKRTGCLPSEQSVNYKSRTMDIDILFYDRLVMDSGKLIIPHPMIEQREFVLCPMNEVIPEYRHPVSGKTAGEMLEDLEK